ncbi:dynactin 6 [Holotrichia oblita]|uniref:Dynactin 6 n=1 Tax=Holotrichia oblita TaxID=644536 RepID=A0ACB9TNN9_HOLOL|nr:dynactin 6 [Holotrichia oblita]
MTSRNNIKIIAGAIVCHEAKLRGDVTIGAGTIMHPCAFVNAEAGPIIIGEKCLVEEQSKITHRVPFDREEQKNVPVLIIGSNNVFEVGCNVEACRIGDNNIFESKCFVGNKVTVTNGCIIGAGCYITEEQVLPENTIIYGEKCLQREALCGPGLPINDAANKQNAAKCLSTIYMNLCGCRDESSIRSTVTILATPSLAIGVSSILTSTLPFTILLNNSETIRDIKNNLKA